MKTPIIEGNKLIGKFMGRFCYDKPSKRPTAGAPEAEPPLNLLKAKYHTSWDWLMSVVKKIKGMPIDDFQKKKPVMNALLDVDINILWQSVVEFIQWYNQKPNL